jgi:hypothetical protein
MLKISPILPSLHRGGWGFHLTAFLRLYSFSIYPKLAWTSKQGQLLGTVFGMSR